MNTLSQMLTVLAASATLTASAYAQNSRKNDHSSDAFLLEIVSASSLADHPALETFKQGATVKIDQAPHPVSSRTADHESTDEPIPHRSDAEDLPRAEFSAAPVCENTDVNAQVREALRLVCDRPISEMTASSTNGDFGLSRLKLFANSAGEPQGACTAPQVTREGSRDEYSASYSGPSARAF